MSKRRISVERLEIRLKGISPQRARAAVDGLGHQLLGRLAEARPGLSGGGRSIKVGRIDAGTFRTSAGTSASDLQTLIARKIAAAIDEQIKR